MIHYETVIGLEVHIQLATKTKAFANDTNKFTNISNQHISAITLALPGVLPKANRQHVLFAAKLAIALESNINEVNYFDRKNYFYPDLPKGYQITQDKRPISVGGKFVFKSDGQDKVVRIHHMHMEEDAGKSVHDLHADYTLLDFNRAGTPLIELVTEPDFRSGQEVHDFISAIQQLVQYLEISDGNMEEGSLRADCNVSVRPMGSEAYGERCEIKNVNSKKFARDAIQYEADRQIESINRGEKISKTTMLYDPSIGKTYPMRKKETENDYRYFTEPDLAPVVLTNEEIIDIKSTIKYLPWDVKTKLANIGISPSELEKIAESKENYILFQDIVNSTDVDPKELANVFVNKILPDSIVANCAAKDLVGKKQLTDFIALYQGGKASKSTLLSTLWPLILKNTDVDVVQKAAEMGLLIQADQGFLAGHIEEVLIENEDKVREYKSGKKGLIGFFLGQVKLKAGNAIDPVVLKQKLEERLK